DLDRLNGELKHEKAKEAEQVSKPQEEQKFLSRRQLSKALDLPYEHIGEGERIPLTIYSNRSELIAEKITEVESQGIQHALIATGITEPFMIWFKLALYAGFVLASPWIFYQMWMFI